MLYSKTSKIWNLIFQNTCLFEINLGQPGLKEYDLVFMNHFITVYKKNMFLACKRNVCETFLLRSKNICLIRKHR